MISRDLKKKQNVKCFNYGKQGHLKRDHKQGVPRDNFFSKHNPFRAPLPLDYADSVAKGDIGLNE